MFDKLPESLQNADKGENMMSAVDNLEEAHNALADIIDYLDQAKA